MLKSAGDKRRGTEYLHGKLKFLNEVCLIKFQIIQTKDTSSKSFQRQNPFSQIFTKTQFFHCLCLLKSLVFRNIEEVLNFALQLKEVDVFGTVHIPICSSLLSILIQYQRFETFHLVCTQNLPKNYYFLPPDTHTYGQLLLMTSLDMCLKHMLKLMGKTD